MALTTEQQMQINSALQPGIQMALPQRLEPVTTKEHQVQRTQYDPEKLQALKSALGIARPTMSKWESVANALANTPQPRSFTGGFGEEIISPWAMGLSNFARGFGSAYAARKADEREKAEQAREDAIKAAQLDYEASKQAIADKITDSQVKVNIDPNVKALAEQEAAKQKLAQTAYVKLNPNLPNDIRKNAKAFSYVGREADIGGRTPSGGTTGIGERLVAGIAKGALGDEVAKEGGRIKQEMAQYVGAVTDMARAGGATGQMMNSDKEGQRALQIMSNPSAYDAEELAAAAEVVIDLYNRMLAVQGLPSVQEGYKQVTQMVEAQQPKQESDPWAKYRQ